MNFDKKKKKRNLFHMGKKWFNPEDDTRISTKIITYMINITPSVPQ